MGQDNRQRPHTELPGIHISPGPAMLDFIDSSFQTLDVRYDILRNYLHSTNSENPNAQHHCALFSESLRKYLKLLGQYIYAPVRELLNQETLSKIYVPVENESIAKIEEIALIIYQLKSRDFEVSEDNLARLHSAFVALKDHHNMQKQVIYPLYLKIWNES